MTRFENSFMTMAGAFAMAIVFATGAGAAEKPVGEKKVEASSTTQAKPQPTKAEAAKPDASKAPAKGRVNTVMLTRPGKGAKATDSPESLHERARNGDPYAQYFMGQKYHYGKGVKENRAAAFGWFNRAAKGRVAAAHYVIGLIRLTGEIGAPDIVEAYARFRIAAKGGDVRAAAMIFYVGPRMNGSELRKSDVRYKALLEIGATKVEAKAAVDKK